MSRRHDLGGTVRAELPGETLARVRPVMGAVGITRVANVTGMDRIGIPVALCIRPNARHLSVSQGKGITFELAKVSAVMESIEGFHAENAPVPSMQSAPRPEIKGIPLVAPEALLPGFRSGLLETGHALQWIQAVDIVSGSPVFLPHVCVDLNSTRAHPDLGVLYTSSNGLASGNTIAEATLHAILELIERDAEDRWLCMDELQRARRHVRLSSIDDPMLREILDKFAAAQLCVNVWDTTSSTALPSFRCVLSEASSDRRLASFQGAGCHLRKQVALARALTEAAQTRLTLITGSRDDLTSGSYARRRIAASRSAAEPESGMPYSSVPDHAPCESLEADLKTAVAAVVAGGFRQIVVVDMTRADLDIPVVFAVIPGARFCGARA